MRLPWPPPSKHEHAHSFQVSLSVNPGNKGLGLDFKVKLWPAQSFLHLFHLQIRTLRRNEASISFDLWSFIIPETVHVESLVRLDLFCTEERRPQLEQYLSPIRFYVHFMRLREFEFLLSKPPERTPSPQLPVFGRVAGLHTGRLHGALDLTCNSPERVLR